mmetsp:Transcript_9023/g.16580  ORF Transcript_9023/g.16580 Transcript_9023/m.16580 type:complete len:264 (+) Transcript_9023:56-847(+)
MASLLRSASRLNGLTGAARRSFASVISPGLVELHEVEVQPGRLKDYLRLSASADAASPQLPAPLGTWTTDLGASSNRVYRLRTWAEGYKERDAAQKAVQANSEATLALSQADACTVKLASSIFVEASSTLSAVGLPGLMVFEPVSQDKDATVAYELRSYQLKLGYTTVPRFLELYQEGLKDKLAADTSGESVLVTLLYCEAGAANLNTVLELWRHRSLHGGQVSREASRSATGWKSAVGQIAAEVAVSFQTQILRPAGGGRLQ